MIKTILVVFIVLFVSVSVLADTVDLTQMEDLQIPQANKLQVHKIEILLPHKLVVVHYIWQNDNNQIAITGKKMQRWLCRNTLDDPETTGVDETDLCWDNIFLFSIRAQDVGTPIGKGLRDLLWNEMKQDILSGGNDGSFQN